MSVRLESVACVCGVRVRLNCVACVCGVRVRRACVAPMAGMGGVHVRRVWVVWFEGGEWGLTRHDSYGKGALEERNVGQVERICREYEVRLAG